MVKPKQPQADDVLIDPPVSPIPLVTPEVVPEAKPEVTPASIAEVVPEASGPEIEYVGEGANKIEFTINSLAKKYVVRSDGMILESF